MQLSNEFGDNSFTRGHLVIIVRPVRPLTGSEKTCANTCGKQMVVCIPPRSPQSWQDVDLDRIRPGQNFGATRSIENDLYGAGSGLSARLLGSRLADIHRLRMRWRYRPRSDLHAIRNEWQLQAHVVNIFPTFKTWRLLRDETSG